MEYIRDFRSRRLGTITFGAAVLYYSNATPFKPRIGNGFRCFFHCRTDFTPADIRTHTQNLHSLHKLKIASGREDNIIKVDIDDLRCTLCSQHMADLSEFERHIVSAHDKKIRKDFADVIVPFKLSSGSYNCQICGKLYAEFQKLNNHMHSHYKHHICEICGDGFITKTRLHNHKLSHEGNYACDICKKCFSSPLKRKNHTDAVHKNICKLICSKCPERFRDHYKKMKHLVEVHNQTPQQYPCEQCAKVFSYKSTLRAHTRKDHLRERSHSCNMCEQKFFYAAELRNHTIKHTGERNFQCQICKKTYARKKTLQEHMKIHNDVRKFVCGSCGQSFVQNCSLKGHIKTHHPDVKGPS